jgi:succinoglycan biosynthesis protein ExoW
MKPSDALGPAAEPDIAVIIPHFQRHPGLLTRAVRSVFAQTEQARALVIVGDDSSPVPAAEELRPLADLPQDRVLIVRRPNGGAGAARNSAMDAIPAGVKYVAFLDSDDAWRPRHLETAIVALEAGFDAYFCNFIGVGYPDIGHFERIGSLRPEAHALVSAEHRIHALSVSALEHTVSDGGGLIGTPTVVYRFAKYPALRFREEFYNGQDFFFWMDLSELGAKFAFSFEILCDNGEGVNIYQASGWGTDKSMQRIRNELFVWTSVNRFYRLTPELKRANWRTIRNLQEGVGRDLLHRVVNRKPLKLDLVRDTVRMAPSTLWRAPWGAISVLVRRVVRSSA